jgi:hypothetical protein
MNNPVSFPQERPQPSQARYALTELYLFVMYDRASYNQAFGTDPPTYDPSKPTKSWFDSSAAASTVPVKYQYWGWNTNGQMVQNTFTLSPADAASVNVWGYHPYPPYVPMPTQATRGGTGPGSFPMPPTVLSTQDQANALATAWKLPTSVVVNGTMAGPFPDIFPASELRRPWAILRGGLVFYAGEQIAIQNADGVGAPGHWDLSGNVPQWVSDIPPQPANLNPEGPIPMRALKANEGFVTGGMMDPGPYVGRTDLGAPAAASAPSGGGLTDAQDQRLQRVEDRVNAIAQRFGIS